MAVAEAPVDGDLSRLPGGVEVGGGELAALAPGDGAALGIGSACVSGVVGWASSELYGKPMSTARPSRIFSYASRWRAVDRLVHPVAVRIGDLDLAHHALGHGLDDDALALAGASEVGLTVGPGPGTVLISAMVTGC
ncbi:hypothetical protein GCM10010441_45200 [Kitasatospora paracochleata]